MENSTGTLKFLGHVLWIIFAAYQAAKIAFKIGKNARAQEWAEKALAVNPEYIPAKNLRQAAINKMK